MPRKISAFDITQVKDDIYKLKIKDFKEHIRRARSLLLNRRDTSGDLINFIESLIGEITGELIPKIIKSNVKKEPNRLYSLLSVELGQLELMKRAFIQIDFKEVERIMSTYEDIINVEEALIKPIIYS